MADAVMALALRMLGRRDHSVAELITKLKTKGCESEEVERVVSRLVELKYLDDHRLADRLAASLAGSGRGVGRRLLLELRKRGIPPGLAEEAEAAIRSEANEVMVARQILTRRYPAFGPGADPRERRRVMGFFQRRGFSLATIWQLLNFTEIEGTDDW